MFAQIEQAIKFKLRLSLYFPAQITDRICLGVAPKGAVSRISSSAALIDINTAISGWAQWANDPSLATNPGGANQQAIFQSYHITDPGHWFLPAYYGIALLPFIPPENTLAFATSQGLAHMDLKGITNMVLKRTGSDTSWMPGPAFEQSPSNPILHKDLVYLPLEGSHWLRKQNLIEGLTITKTDQTTKTANVLVGHRGNGVDEPGSRLLYFIDQTDPYNPEVLGHWEAPGPILYRDPCVDQSTGYVAVPVKKDDSKDTSWFVLDIRIPASPSIIAVVPGGTRGAMSSGLLYISDRASISVVDLTGNAGAARRNLLNICGIPTNVSYSGTVNMAMDWDWSAGSDRENGLNFDVPQEQRKYTFWVNDDIEGQSGPTENYSQTNSDNKIIDSIRDLENFSRLQLKIDSRLRNRDDITFSLRFGPVEGTNPTPSINIFTAIDPTTNYRREPETAGNQALGEHSKTSEDLVALGTKEVQIPASAIKWHGDIVPFVFEGKTPGKGSLILTAQKDGLMIPGAEATVELTLAEIRKFYETSVLKFSGVDLEIYDSQIVPHTPELPYEPEGSDYILFVHGYRMEADDKDRWTERMFKRLYLQGYRGRVGSFQWPAATSAFFDNEFDSENYFSSYISTYNISDYRAYKSGEHLTGILENLIDDGKKIHLLAHSQGNIVVSQALRELKAGYKIQNYIATQAAVPVDMFVSNESVPYAGSGSPKTPNLFSRFPTGTRRSRPYFGSIHEKVEGTMYNYFNTRDSALNWWRRNNYGWLWLLGDKPASGYKYVGRPNGRYDENRNYFKHGDNKLTIEDNLFEIFAFGVRPRSNALGSENRDVGHFRGVNLNGIDPSFNNDSSAHSKQFNSNIASEWKYWDRVMKDFKFKEDDN
ncbi:MAG: alpha/beta hydrolase [Holophagaceae bacterium]|nr:alpha/beta hydrolase [Holophagaceae bacterium]